MKVRNCTFWNSESIFLHRGWLYLLERLWGGYMLWKQQIRSSIWNNLSELKEKIHLNVLLFSFLLKI